MTGCNFFQHGPRQCGLLLALAVAAGLGSPARGQDVFLPEPPSWREPILGRSAASLMLIDRPDSPADSASRPSRVPLFRMPAGFLYDPPGLDQGDDPPPEAIPGLDVPAESANDLNILQLSMGLDNPYFDYRLPTDPGGVGYYQIHSQLQLLDQGKTAVCLGLQAFTPAGLDAKGLAQGPTFFSPGLAWYQELGAGTALQGYVAKQIRAGAGWYDELESHIEYGVAVEYALPNLTTNSQHRLLFFVEAIGRFRNEGEAVSNRPATWEVIPGIHWRMGDGWSLSVGAARRSLVRWSWQF